MGWQLIHLPSGFPAPCLVHGAWLGGRTQVAGDVRFLCCLAACCFRFGFWPLCFGFVWFISFVFRLELSLETMGKFVENPKQNCENDWTNYQTFKWSTKTEAWACPGGSWERLREHLAPGPPRAQKTSKNWHGGRSGSSNLNNNHQPFVVCVSRILFEASFVQRF